MVIVQLSDTRFLNLANVVQVDFSGDRSSVNVITTATDARITYNEATASPAPHILTLQGDEAKALWAALRRLSGVSS